MALKGPKISKKAGAGKTRDITLKFLRQ